MPLTWCVEMFDTRGMEKLHEYIATHPDWTDAQWADHLGMSRTHFNEIRNGKAFPSKTLMVKIEANSGGAIPILAWFPVSA